MDSPPQLRRISQSETQEAREAVARLKDPTVQEERERRLEARSHAQGGRWLESSTVEREGSRGYGTPDHAHRPQHKTPEVRAALEGRASPEFREVDEKLREARAMAQGGRWMDEGNMPRDTPSQNDQPEVQAALRQAADPTAREEAERKHAARAAAQGGRWLD